MNNPSVSCLTRDLFDCRVPYLTALFASSEYPWDMLPRIKEYVASIIRNGLPSFRRIAENVLVGEGVRIAPTAVIEGCAVIGPGCELRPGAYLRGGVICGCDCVIGNSSELKNCVLLDRVQAPHYNYIGDSILGNHAHMGAGAVCSNLKSDGKNVVIHGETDYDTCLRKVGGILGDGADIGCGCVLNPGTVIGKETSVYPLTPLRGVIPGGCIVKAQNNIVIREGIDICAE